MNNDLISRSAQHKHLLGPCVAKYPSSFTMGLLAAARELDAAPSMELVPCSECKHYDERFNPNSNNYCYIDGGPVHRIMPPDGFCSYGERREK